MALIIFITWSIDVLKRIIRPTTEVPTRTIKAPAPVIRVEIPSHETRPNNPALEITKTDTKKSRPPTVTLGWDRGVLSFEIRSPNERNINGKNKVVQEK